MMPRSSKSSSFRALCALLLTICLSHGVFAQVPEAPPAAKPIRVLMVGNSFAANVATYFSAFVKESQQTPILLVCMKGGCSLQQHAEGLAASLVNPDSPQARIYSKGWFTGSHPGFPKNYNMLESLRAEKWDYVTIQQYSALSYKPETYEPYAHQVVDAIRQYAPQAEILVHETWAYREDDALFKKGDFTQQKMYDGLKAAYAKLAADYHLRTIPNGDAFQAARATERWHYVRDAAFNFAHPSAGTLPVQPGSLNMGWGWRTDPETQVVSFVLDAHHANVAGKYLGSAVLYETLTGNDVQKLTFCPKELDSVAAADLRRIAHETVQLRKAEEAKTAPVVSAAAAPQVK